MIKKTKRPRKPVTPRSKVRAALRLLWLRSRERQAALKRDGYTCRCCGMKQSKAKGRECAVEVHHIHEIDNWDVLIDQVYRFLLAHPDNLVTLCHACHDAAHDNVEDLDE